MSDVRAWRSFLFNGFGSCIPMLPLGRFRSSQRRLVPRFSRQRTWLLGRKIISRRGAVVAEIRDNVSPLRAQRLCCCKRSTFICGTRIFGRRKRQSLIQFIFGCGRRTLVYTAKPLHSTAQGRVKDAHPGGLSRLRAYAEGVIQIWPRHPLPEKD